jgi:hypothetical protein
MWHASARPHLKLDYRCRADYIGAGPFRGRWLSFLRPVQSLLFCSRGHSWESGRRSHSTAETPGRAGSRLRPDQARPSGLGFLGGPARPCPARPGRALHQNQARPDPALPATFASLRPGSTKPDSNRLAICFLISFSYGGIMFLVCSGH